MNEQIKELRNLAWKEAFGVDPSDPRIARAHATMEAGMEKFAELIVRECQERVEHYIRDCGEIGSLPDTVIKKHFGVEE